MNYFKNQSPLNKYKWEGMVRGFLSTLPGSFLFAIAFLLKFDFENDYSQIPFVTLFAIFLGLVFSFFPSILGGYLLANWIFIHPSNASHKGGMIKGAIVGGACMLTADFALGVLSLPMSHGPTLGMFLFYVISSVLIASLMGAFTGLALSKVLPKYKQANPSK
jgi:hypothetical protein